MRAKAVVGPPKRAHERHAERMIRLTGCKSGVAAAPRCGEKERGVKDTAGNLAPGARTRSHTVVGRRYATQREFGYATIVSWVSAYVLALARLTCRRLRCRRRRRNCTCNTARSRWPDYRRSCRSQADTRAARNAAVLCHAAARLGVDHRHLARAVRVLIDMAVAVVVDLVALFRNIGAYRPAAVVLAAVAVGMSAVAGVLLAAVQASAWVGHA